MRIEEPTDAMTPEKGQWGVKKESPQQVRASGPQLSGRRVEKGKEVSVEDRFAV